MALELLKDYQAPGTSPGTLRPAEGEAGPPRIIVTTYSPESVETREVASVDALREAPGDGMLRWVHVVGLGDIATVARLGEIFSLHALALEDVVHLGQRPKIEEYDDVLFSTSQLLAIDGDAIEKRQVSMFVGSSFVVSFQESGADHFATIRTRLEQVRGRLRQRGPGYLAYAMLDLVVDSAFPALERIGERLEALDDRIVERPDRRSMGALQDVRQDLLKLRQVLWPQREVLSRLARDEDPLLGAETRVYLRDCYDHAVQALEVSENYREVASGLLDIYLSSISNRLNDVMKVLTVISTVFMPLGFLAGVYGMNFRTEGTANMPELGWRFGYFGFWAVCILAAGGMLLWFRRKDWL